MSAQAEAQNYVNRSVPYVGFSCKSRDKRAILDRFEFSLSELDKPDLSEKIRLSLDVAEYGDVLFPESTIELLLEQFLAASEYIYGHPLWKEIRDGSQEALYAYLMETRHFLAAAASRMSPSIGQGIGLSPILLLLSKHLLEEWDHAKFFSDALQVIGCSQELVSAARPIPSTLEWIHVTRAIGFKSTLSAAACSGFMEFSSKEIEAVEGWHRMLYESGLVPDNVSNCIFRHFETDLGLEHADNWQRAIRAAGPLTSGQVAEILNDVTTIAEMIYRWLTAVLAGCASKIVTAIQLLSEDPSIPLEPMSPFESACFSGLPVWPSGLLQVINGVDGDVAENPASKTIVAAAYAFGRYPHYFSNTQNEFSRVVGSAISSLASETKTDSPTIDGLEAMVRSWLTSIDGHRLWADMEESPSDPLIAGYILENYHYLASATRHISAAISSCPSAVLRLQLIEHLRDELEHCEIMNERLREYGLVGAESMRPLSTTTAFVGFLEILGRTDWKGYFLASAFLQASLSECRLGGRNEKFYEAVTNRCSTQAGSLLRTIWQHDRIDGELGHDGKPRERLLHVIECGIGNDSIEQAGVAPLLAWSFLDGIREHYSNGIGSVSQRVGWRG